MAKFLEAVSSQERHARCLKNIDICNDWLIQKKFDECLHLSQRSIREAEDYPENRSSRVAVESLCILAIQCFAELNRWQEALPYVTSLYNGIEDCPPKVVQMCVLLHAQMNDYATCSAVSNIWLRNPHNFTNPEYHILVEIFLQYVLLAQQRWQDVEPFLNSCGGLDKERRQRYMTHTKTVQAAVETKKLKDAEEIKKKQEADKTSNESIPSGNYMLQVMKNAISYITRYIPPAALHVGKYLLFLTVFMYWILTRANFDMLSNKRILGIFQSVLQLWRCMLGPFHLARQ